MNNKQLLTSIAITALLAGCVAPQPTKLDGADRVPVNAHIAAKDNKDAETKVQTQGGHNAIEAKDKR